RTGAPKHEQRAVGRIAERAREHQIAARVRVAHEPEVRGTMRRALLDESVDDVVHQGVVRHCEDFIGAGWRVNRKSHTRSWTTLSASTRLCPLAPGPRPRRAPSRRKMTRPNCGAVNASA